MKKTTNLFLSLLLLSCISYYLSGCNTKGYVNESGETVTERINPPDGYEWEKEGKRSFGKYLQNLKLEAPGSPILDYTGRPISNQSAHVAIIKKDIGNKDLQQCADAIIRLRADYLWETRQYDKIKFHFTSGDLYKWSDYKQGIRPVVSGGNHVTFTRSAAPDNSAAGYRKYLDIIFMYAGTISLDRETRKVTNAKDIKAGDVIVTPGSPGHAVIVLATAKNKKGKKLYLLAEGYTPAQSIHIMKNLSDSYISPWYELRLSGGIKTARYDFKTANIRSF